MAKDKRRSSTRTASSQAAVTLGRLAPDKRSNVRETDQARAAERLRVQVERIIDEGDGTRRSVIVRATSGQRTSEQLLSIAADVHRRRNLSLTARDLLPAPRDQLEALRQVAGGRLTPSAKRTLEQFAERLSEMVSGLL